MRHRVRQRLSAATREGAARLRRAWRALGEIAERSYGIGCQSVRTWRDDWYARAKELTPAYAHDDRQALLLLSLPFLVAATAIIAHQSGRAIYTFVDLPAIGTPEREIAFVSPGPTRSNPPPTTELTPSAATAYAAPAAETPSPARPGTAVSRLISTKAAGPDLSAHNDAPALDTTNASLQPGLLAPRAPSAMAAPANPHGKLALLSPAPTSTPRTVAPFAIESYEADANGSPIVSGMCTAADGAGETPFMANLLETGAIGAASLGPEAFGRRLAHAAEAQASNAQSQSVVIYDDAYRSISFPMGDVNSMFGVCTDVVVRAYRTLGIDLQSLVYRARSGLGDHNIDHRRTEVLRRFFTGHGETLPVSSFPEDYRPGDIVTYYRPQNRGSRAHIAIVSSRIAPSGRPMIVHNRGWGPQLEDALFVDHITGHYRYRGPERSRDAAHQTRRKTQAATAHPRRTQVAPAAVSASLQEPAR